MTTRDFIYSRLSGLVSVLSGGDATALDILHYSGSGTLGYEDVQRALDYIKPAPSDALASDLSRIFGGREPEYFIHAHALAERYRRAHGVVMARERETVYRFEDLVRLAERPLGTVYEQGLACPEEQAFFYATGEWRRRAEVMRVLDGYRCRSCGATCRRQKVEIHAHHMEPIYSAYSRRFQHNFDECRILVLCKACHEQFHGHVVKTAWGFEPMQGEARAEQQRQLARDRRAHDEGRTCRWCYHRTQTV